MFLRQTSSASILHCGEISLMSAALNSRGGVTLAVFFRAEIFPCSNSTASTRPFAMLLNILLILVPLPRNIYHSLNYNMHQCPGGYANNMLVDLCLLQRETMVNKDMRRLQGNRKPRMAVRGWWLRLHLNDQAVIRLISLTNSEIDKQLRTAASPI